MLIAGYSQKSIYQEMPLPEVFSLSRQTHPTKMSSKKRIQDKSTLILSYLINPSETTIYSFNKSQIINDNQVKDFKTLLLSYQKLYQFFEFVNDYKSLNLLLQIKDNYITNTKGKMKQLLKIYANYTIINQIPLPEIIKTLSQPKFIFIKDFMCNWLNTQSLMDISKLEQLAGLNKQLDVENQHKFIQREISENQIYQMIKMIELNKVSLQDRIMDSINCEKTNKFIEVFENQIKGKQSQSKRLLYKNLIITNLIQELYLDIFLFKRKQNYIRKQYLQNMISQLNRKIPNHNYFL